MGITLWIMGSVVTWVAYQCGMGGTPEPPSRVALVSYTRRLAGDALTDVQALPVDTMQLTVHSDCHTHPTIEGLEAGTRIKLKGRLPDELIEDLMPRIFVPGTRRNENSYVDTKVSIQTAGEAYVHYVWFHLESTEESSDLCLNVALLKIETAETVSEWIEEQKDEVIGFENDCSLWGFHCKQRAITRKTTKRLPVYRQQQLTLNQQRDLRRYLTSCAVASASELVGDEKRLT